MRILAIHAHPTADSFNADLHRAVIARLGSEHEVENCDLHAEGLNPVLDAEDFREYESDKIPEDLRRH